MKLPDVNPHLLQSNSFISRTPQLCICTDDFEATIKAYSDQLGIGPWWINTYEAPTLRNTTYYGEPVETSMKIALAFTGDFNWEIIQPLKGPSIYRDFIDQHGPGAQHVGVYLQDFDQTWDDLVQTFLDRGCTICQEGSWNEVRWKYFNAPNAAHMCIELIDRPTDWVRPEPLAWYPHPPRSP